MAVYEEREMAAESHGSHLRVAVSKICGIRASAVGRIARGDGGARGILVSSHARGERKKSPSKIAMGAPIPSARDINGVRLYPLDMLRSSRS